MNWRPSQALQPARELPAHLAELGGRLRDLTAEVRGNVANLSGDALGRAVRDALTHFWCRQPAPAPRPQRPVAEPGPYGWLDDPADDWRRDEPGWSEEYRSPLPPATDPQNAAAVPSTAHMIALALHGAGWWLQRYGSWWGAVGVGCTVGGLALVGGKIAITGFSLLQAIGELYALQSVLTSTGNALPSE